MLLIEENFINFKSESNKDKYKLVILSLMPIFLIIGTAVSEFALITLSLIYIYEFLIKKEIEKKNLLFFLLFIYLCLIVNLIFSENIDNSILRNITFIKYVIFVIGTTTFLPEKKYRINFILKSWLIITIIFSIDMFIQFFIGKNIIGLESPLKLHRVSGFMGDELKAGALMLGISLSPACFLIRNKKYKNIGLLILIFFLSSIFISGDRSNFIKSIIIFLILLFFLKKHQLKKVIFLVSILITFMFLVILNLHTFKERYVNNIYSDLASYNFNIIKYTNNTEYGKIYYTGLKLFEKNKIFGVGNKNFRLLCDEDNKKKFLNENKVDKNRFRCNIHPHQIYIEFLAEHGIFGFTALLISIFFFIKSNILMIFRKKDILLSCFFLNVLIYFVQILPGGSFFSSFNATIFWLNFSLFYSYKYYLEKN